MKIERPTLIRELIAFATAGHGLVLGKPGVGKTYCLGALAEHFETEETPYVLLRVEQFGDGTEEDLRIALGYASTFSDELKSLFAAGTHGVVIFDGFDATRNDEARARVLNRIDATVRDAPAGWSVIVSVRNYDAAKSPALQDIFSATSQNPSGQRSDSSVAARNFLIPELTDEEVSAAAVQIQGLSEILSKAPHGLRSLARLPFNLWLLKRVLESIEGASAVGALQSQTELLSLFWKVRVTSSADGLARTAALSRVARSMVDKSKLSVPVEEAYVGPDANAWAALFSAEILVNVGKESQRIAFGHNILFDFAVGALLIEPNPEALERFLAADPSRPLFLRPSLTYFFTRLWYEERTVFWRCFRSLIASPQVPLRLVGRIVPAFVVASEARSFASLEPALDAALSPEALGEVVLRLLQGLRFTEPTEPLAWVELCERAARTPTATFAWELTSFLERALQLPAVLGHVTARDSVGRAARSIFKWAWEQALTGSAWHDDFAARPALGVVLKTFGTDPAAGEELIRPVLKRIRDDNVPTAYFSTLADGVGAIVSASHALARDIYLAVFSYRDAPESSTAMGGIVMPMRSTRRQDFGMCRYLLAREFVHFLEASPEVAISTGLDVLNEFAIAEHVVPYLLPGKSVTDGVQTFRFQGEARRYLQDASAGWWQVVRDDETVIADALTSHMAEPDLEPKLVAAKVTTWAGHAFAAVTWCKLLEAAAQSPATLANQIHELVLSPVFQTGADVLEAIGTLIERCAEYWSKAQRLALEESLLTLGRSPSSDEGSDRARRRIRDRLIARLPREMLQTSEARTRMEELSAAGAVPGNDPLVNFQTSWSAVTDESLLASQGVDLAAQANAELVALSRTASDFGKRWLNEQPDSPAVEAVLPNVRSLLGLLTTQSVPKSPVPDDRVIEHAWSALAGAARGLAKTRPEKLSELHDLLKTILLAALRRPGEPVGPNADAEFTTPSWGPTSRAEATLGIADLIDASGDPACIDELGRLLESSDPRERYLAVRGLASVARVALDRFVGLADRLAKQEGNVVVAQTLLHVLARAFGVARDRLAPTVSALVTRWRDTSSRDLQTAIAEWLAYAGVRDQLGWATALLSECFSALPQRGELFKLVVDLLVRGSGIADLEVHPAQAGRAVAWIVDSLRRLEELLTAGGLLHDIVEKGRHKELQRLGHDVAFAVVSNALFNLQGRGDAGRHALKRSAQREYWQSAKPALEGVISLCETQGLGGMVPATAHYFMQVFNVVLEFDPPLVLSLAARVLVTGGRVGYQLDPLAVREVVGLMEIVLADHRGVVAQGAPLQNALTILDTFASVGWPEALRLVWRLDEVFR